jgi:hypothetical protein
VACVEVLLTEPRVASMAEDLDAVEEPEKVLARGSAASRLHCLTSALAVLGRGG